MSLVNHVWFRALAYVGIFILSWSIEFLYLRLVNNELAYSLCLFILGALLPFLVSLALTFKFMVRDYLVGPIVINVVNLIFGIALYALILIAIAVGSGMG